MSYVTQLQLTDNDNPIDKVGRMKDRGVTTLFWSSPIHEKQSGMPSHD